MEAVPRAVGHGVAAPVEVRVLGGFEVVVAGRSVARADWRRVSAERLFKLLLVAPGHRASREVAGETLWPDAEPEASRARLRKAIHFAGQALHDSDLLVASRDSIGIRAEALDLDLDRLHAAFATLAADQDDPSHRDAALHTVVELGGAELLPEDPYEDWLVGPRERLTSRWQLVAMEAAKGARDAGQRAVAHEIVDRLLERDPTDEAAHRLAIELFLAEGRHHAARRQFEECRRALREGLDAEPGEETVETYQRAERNGGGSGGPGRVTVPRLVARREEMDQIEAILDQVSGGSLTSLVIRGPAGIGKTRLLDELGAYARSSGSRVIEWRAVEALRVEAFAPLRLALAGRLSAEQVDRWPEPARSGVATLLPSLVEHHLEFRDQDALVVGLVAAVVQLAREAPLVLLIDDLPWLDEASVLLLSRLFAGASDVPILVAVTCRDDERLSGRRQALFDQMRRAGAVTLALEALAPRDVDPLVIAHLGGQSVEPTLARRAWEASRGNPLFLLELARAGIEHGVIRRRAGRWELDAAQLSDELPESARQIVAHRLTTLSDAARDVLAVAAELRGDVPYGVLSSALPIGPDALVGALDLALASGLLVESGPGYAFAHPLYRVAVRGTVAPHRRGAIHLAIANALAAPRDSPQDAAALHVLASGSSDAVAVAEHALAAVDLGVHEAVPLAVAFGFVAGDRLVALHDREGASSVLGRAMVAWRRLPPDDRRRVPAAAALIHLGVLAAEERPDEAASLFRDAMSAARDDLELVRAYEALSEYTAYRRGNFEHAVAMMREALGRLPETSLVPRAHLQAILAWALVRLRRGREALPILEASVAVLEGSDDVFGRIRALDGLGVALHYLGRPSDGLPYIERVLATSLEHGDGYGEFLGNLHLGMLLTRAGAPAEAIPRLERAAELGGLTGDLYLESMASWGLAEAADAAGDLVGARSARRRQLDLLERLGGNPHNAAMAEAHIANLAHRLHDTIAADHAATRARELARLSPETGYAELVEHAIRTVPWDAMT